MKPAITDVHGGLQSLYEDPDALQLQVQIQASRTGPVGRAVKV